MDFFGKISYSYSFSGVFLSNVEEEDSFSLTV